MNGNMHKNLQTWTCYDLEMLWLVIMGGGGGGGGAPPYHFEFYVSPIAWFAQAWKVLEYRGFLEKSLK